MTPAADALGDRRVVSLSAGPVAYHERGSGSPIVLIHGVLMNADTWRDAVPTLAASHRCIAPDWPTGGHRTALNADARITPEALADLVVEFLAALDLRDATLVGLGLGTVLCEIVAIRRPERVGRVVFAPGDILSTFPPRWARLRFAVAYAPPIAGLLVQALHARRVRRLAYRRFAHTMPDALAESFTRGLRHDRRVRRDALKLLRAIFRGRTYTPHSALAEFDRPALVLWGSDDRAFPQSHPDDLMGLLPNAELTVIDGAHTFLAQDQPHAFAAAIDAFILGYAARSSVRREDAPMHAVVIRVTIKDVDNATTELREQVVPRVSQAPGFVAGYWTREGNTGLSMVVFESEEAARAASAQLPSGMPDSVALEDVEVREVVANA